MVIFIHFHCKKTSPGLVSTQSVRAFWIPFWLTTEGAGGSPGSTGYGFIRRMWCSVRRAVSAAFAASIFTLPLLTRVAAGRNAPADAAIRRWMRQTPEGVEQNTVTWCKKQHNTPSFTFCLPRITGNQIPGVTVNGCKWGLKIWLISVQEFYGCFNAPESLTWMQG